MFEGPDPDSVAPGTLIVRLAWIVVQLIAVLYFGQQGTLFFYQMF